MIILSEHHFAQRSHILQLDQPAKSCRCLGSIRTMHIDKIYIKYCKNILGARQQTPNYAVFGELGHFPMPVIAKEGFKILDKNKSARFSYFLRQVNDIDVHPWRVTWASEVKRHLNTLGLSHF